MIKDRTIIFGKNTLVLSINKQSILTIHSMDKSIPSCLKTSWKNLERANIKSVRSIEFPLNHVIYIKLIEKKITDMLSSKSTRLSFEYAGYTWDFSECNNGDCMASLFRTMQRAIKILLWEERKRHEKVEE